MTTAAMILWVTTIVCVTATTVYFFLKVLKTPPQEGEHEPPHIKSFDAT